MTQSFLLRCQLSAGLVPGLEFGISDRSAGLWSSGLCWREQQDTVFSHLFETPLALCGFLL